MAKHEVKESDCLDGRKTILSNPLSVLKVALQFVKNISPGSKFVDPEFGPTDVDDSAPNSLYFNGQPLMGSPSPDEIQWRRVNEIHKAGTFASDEFTSSDVIQGSLGDCWFISALSVLATRDSLVTGTINKEEIKNSKLDDKMMGRLLQGVRPALFQFLEKFGLFVFKFMKNYRWWYVIVDDALPVDANRMEAELSLQFARCNSENEFWVSLIEKAYAKLNWNYGALLGGSVNEGLFELSGLQMENLTVEKDQELWKDHQRMFKKLQKEQETQSLMGCSIRQKGGEIEGKVTTKDGSKKNTGLIASHAYGFLAAVEMGNKERLVVLRNPWGNSEWLGQWSDGSVELREGIKQINEELKKIKKEEFEELRPGEDDGVFVMSIADFCNYFTNISIAKKFDVSFSGRRFELDYDDKSCPNFPLGTSLTPELIRKFPPNKQIVFTLKR